MKTERLGDDLAVRIPREIAGMLGLREGDDASLDPMANGMLLVNLSGEAREAALATLRSLARPAPPGFRFSREEANERG